MVGVGRRRPAEFDSVAWNRVTSRIVAICCVVLFFWSGAGESAG